MTGALQGGPVTTWLDAPPLLAVHRRLCAVVWLVPERVVHCRIEPQMLDHGSMMQENAVLRCTGLHAPR